MIFSVSITLLFAVSSHADTIHVPADQPTIQAGIDRAVDGDTVLVAPGTYVENIDFKGKGITVKSSSGAESTVINGKDPQDPDYGSVVFFMKWEQADSVLEGFSLMKGSGTYLDYWGFWDPYGGGIFCKASSPTILNNIITENDADFGGGISCLDGASPVIFNNTIVNNHVGPPAGWGCGGGICCYKSSPMISNNSISENQAEALGGGIFCWSGSSPMIIDNRICFNETGVGGGINCDGSSPAILNNLIMGNIGLDWAGGISFWYSSSLVFNNIISLNSAPMGGGVYVFSESSPTFSNNSIIGNSAGQGGAVYCSDDSHPVFTNTILWENVAHIEGSEIWIGTKYHQGSSLTIDYSDVMGGKNAAFVESGSSLNWGLGMIDADPLFVEAVNGDFHLTFNSPCRDSGDNSAVTELYDFEGDPRIAYGTVDMGADEFYTHLYCIGQFNPGGRIYGKLVGLPGATPTGLFFGSGVLDPPLPTIWGNFHLQAPWLMIPLVPIPGDGVLVLPATLPATPPAPYDLPMQALIGLELDSLSNLFVLEVR
jgi:hypothetical protein